MAGTLNALLVIVGVCGLTELWGGVQANNGAMCPSIEQCSRDFNDKAMAIGHDREELCKLLIEELRCYNNERASCSAEQNLFVQNKVQNAQKSQRQTCGATWIAASYWLLTVSAILAVLFHRRHL